MFSTRRFWKCARVLHMGRHTDMAFNGQNQGFLQHGTVSQDKNHPSQNANSGKVFGALQGCVSE